MATQFPIHPAHPERICWGCDQFCATTAMACANERAAHPSELFGDDWLEWGNQQCPNEPVKDARMHPSRTDDACPTNDRGA